LIGHSFGGLVVLEAARNNPVFSKIAVYEPGVSIDGSISMDWVPGYEQKLAEKKYFDAFVKFSLSIGITQPCVAAGRPSRSGGKRSEERLMSIPTVYGMRSMLHWFVHASGG
jgi:pimeloyl-ACP methyl ester carboxylesterase